jgi:hypothetical protein
MPLTLPTSSKALLARAMLDPSALEELLLLRMTEHPMPFNRLADNLVLLAIRELYAQAKPVDILTVFELIDRRGGGVTFAELVAMVNAPLLEPLRTEHLCIRPFLPGDCDMFVSVSVVIQ